MIGLCILAGKVDRMTDWTRDDCNGAACRGGDAPSNSLKVLSSTALDSWGAGSIARLQSLALLAYLNPQWLQPIAQLSDKYPSAADNFVMERPLAPAFRFSGRAVAVSAFLPAGGVR